MPSTVHEVPILIFRDRPALLLELLGDALLASPARWDRVEDKSNDLNQLAPIELRADLVLVFYLGEVPVLVIVVEVQRAPDPDKLKSWPAYVAELVNRHGCPCYLVVVAEDELTADWAGQPNPYFQPNSPFLPLVLAPGDVPVVDSTQQALSCPEAALLSLTVHGRGPRGLDVAAALVQVAPRWKQEYKLICAMLLMQLLDPEQRHALEVRFGMDLTEWYRNNENEAIRRSWVRGKDEGKAEAVLKVLQARGLALTPAQKEQILHCQDAATLDRWLVRALTATTAGEVLEAV